MIRSLIATAIGKLLATGLGWKLVQLRVDAMPPHRHLYDLDGSLYMGRWRVIDEGTRASRVLEALTGYSSIRLHLIMRPDHDRDLHNHPFSYRTFVLHGFYRESYAVGLYGIPYNRPIVKGCTATGGDQHFHRITDVSQGGVWTLFCMSKNTERWGFNVEGKFIDSVRYLARKGYTRKQIEGVQTL